ncbi:predicted protein [Nematostella vectensis]|uniref:Uncharacterized protein n=1 Tax=Nematostella vectensis TaxID=45351 RepID=A8DWV1_NEMVE|nr:predicted protein [Nematostella vectensis]|eukprot:XP_001617409.1 hypothetical protein NEMVEDRAFT_v1g226109 [Nematostella vectensis]
MTGTGAQAIKLDNAIDFANNTDYGTRILKRKEFTKMSVNSDVLETRLNDQDLYTSSLYDDHSRPVATVVNAQWKDIAFTSFEVQNGRWVFNNSYVSHTPTLAMTGQHVYDLIQSTNDIVSPILSDKDYIVAFWVKSTSEPTAELYNTSNTTPVIIEEMNVVGDWKLYVAKFEAVAGDVFKLYNGTGDAMAIDEIRLHPTEASMTSYAYEALCGITSKTDARNYIIYYDYDQFGRAVHERTIHGEIISKLEQFAQQADN